MMVWEGSSRYELGRGELGGGGVKEGVEVRGGFFKTCELGVG